MKIKILKQEDYEATIKLTIEVDGKTERFGFSKGQIENGDWKRVVKTWAEQSKIKVENLEGKSVEI